MPSKAFGLAPDKGELLEGVNQGIGVCSFNKYLLNIYHMLGVENEEVGWGKVREGGADCLGQGSSAWSKYLHHLDPGKIDCWTPFPLSGSVGLGGGGG